MDVPPMSIELNLFQSLAKLRIIEKTILCVVKLFD